MQQKYQGEYRSSSVNDKKQHLLVLHYQVKELNFINKSMKKRLRILVPCVIKAIMTLQGTHLNARISITDKTNMCPKQTKQTCPARLERLLDERG